MQKTSAKKIGIKFTKIQSQYEDIFGVTRIAWPEADATLAAQTTKPSGDNNAIGLIGGTLTVAN